MAKLNGIHEGMMARMDSQLEKMNTTVLEANQEKTGATDLQEYPEETESKSEH
jgi:hypothetical protein